VSGLRVAVVSQYYPPEIGAPQARVLETARAWARAGHRVTVLTGFPNHPTGVVPARWRGRLAGEEREPGVRVLRSWLLAARNRGALRRTLAHATCAATSLVRGLAGAGDPDVVVATSPPLFTGLSGWALARVRRRPFVLEVRDLWPDAFVDLGLAREGPAVAAFRRLERFLYRAADHVVPVTDSFADRIADAGVPRARITVVRGGVDLARFPREEARDATRERHGLAGRFVVLYLGAHGTAQGLDRLLPAAALAGPGVLLWFVGEGAEKERVEAEARRLGLANVRFDPGVPREEVPAVYAASDAVLVSLRATPLMETFLPSKAFEAMGAARPVVAAVAGEAKRLLEAGEGAVVVPPGDPPALARAVRALAADPARAAALGVAARARAEREFDREALAARYADVLAAVVAAGKGRGR
jgi:glycosyltransferase involved in cell wall biosynthesis